MNKINAKIRTEGSAVNGKRNRLAETIPLNTPYSIQFFPIYTCNFKCNYCVQSLPLNKRPIITDKIKMPLHLFKKIINELKQFPEKIKTVHFAGMGEPLLDKDIVEMVRYLKKADIAENIDIITNGSLLTHELSEQLIDSGLNKLRVSLQGLDRGSYYITSKININYDEFVAELKYFYDYCNKKKQKCKLYIKIIDIALGEYSAKDFYSVFGKICHDMSIENLVPIVNEINYQNRNYTKTIEGLETNDVEICPQPFYTLIIYPDGNCVPCCTFDKRLSVGNCNKDNIFKIWNGDKLHEFKKMHILNQKGNNIVCRTCNQYKYNIFKEDILDNDVNLIKKKMKI